MFHTAIHAVALYGGSLTVGLMFGLLPFLLANLEPKK